ncbi:MAG: MFS transporter [Desulfobacteraceae bacterium]|nr:MFS transporter [Desulfobacteraceae bacterium]
MSDKRSRAQTIGWVLYDFGMAWFSMVVLTAYFILYFKEVVVGEKGYGDFLWGVAISSAMAVSVILSPLLGAIADIGGMRKRFLIVFSCLSIASTCLLYFTGPGQTLWAVFLLIAGYVGYTVAMTFYNAFLPDIAGQGSIEKISGIGWGVGYIGGLIALLLMAVMVPDVAGGRSIVLVTGVVYGVFALPSFVLLKDPAREAGACSASIGTGMRRLAGTFREIRSYRKIFIFLIGYFFISDAISTVIVFFSSYTVHTLNFSLQQNFLLLMLIQLTAALGAFAAGFVAQRIGILPTMIVTVLIWLLALLGIILFSSISAFFALSVCAGLVLGGTQATARSFVAVRTPSDKQAEFFGFMTFSTKIAAIFGPLLYGSISARTNNPRIAIVSLEVLFIIGLGIMLYLAKSGDDPSSPASISS